MSAYGALGVRLGAKVPWIFGAATFERDNHVHTGLQLLQVDEAEEGEEHHNHRAWPDNAGKSTLLYGLKNELPKGEVTPTIGFTPSKLVSGKYTIQYFDIGGARNFRNVWKSYYAEVSSLRCGLCPVLAAASAGICFESSKFVFFFC